MAQDTVHPILHILDLHRPQEVLMLRDMLATLMDMRMRMGRHIQRLTEDPTLQHIMVQQHMQHSNKQQQIIVLMQMVSIQ